MGSKEGRELKESSLEQAVYLSVQSRPGSTVDFIAKQHKRRPYTVEGSLRRLGRWEYIASTEGLYRNRLFFPKGIFSLTHTDLFHTSPNDIEYVVSEPIQDIVQYIAARGYASTLKEIVRSTGQELDEVEVAIRTLENLGIVERGLQSARKEYVTLTSGVVIDQKKVSNEREEQYKLFSECEKKILFMKMLRQPVLRQVIAYVAEHGQEENGSRSILLEGADEERSRYEYTRQLQKFGFVSAQKTQRGTLVSLPENIEKLYRELTGTA